MNQEKKKLTPLALVLISRIKHIVSANETPGMYENAIERIREINVLICWMGAEGEHVLTGFDFATIKGELNVAYHNLGLKVY